MTNEERIKSILAECEHDYIGYDNLHGDGEQGLKLIAEALEKQIPKKPADNIKCPRCGMLLRKNYPCWNCYQVIDWSDSDEKI